MSSRRLTPARIGLFSGPLAALVAGLVLDFGPAHPHADALAAVAVWMSIWWMTEAVPLAVTSLLPIVLFPLLGIMGSRETCGHYFSPILTLYLGGFLVALAMERWHLHRRIALGVIGAVGTGPSAMLLGFMTAAALLSMWVSNTATALMMLPIGLAVTERLEAAVGAERGRPLGIALMLGIAYGCSIGGIGTPVGTPTNLAFLAIYRDTFPDGPAIGFGQWMLFAVPLGGVMLVATWAWLRHRFLRDIGDARLDASVIEAERRAQGPITAEEVRVAVVFVSAALLWMFRQDLVIGDFRLPGWSSLHPALANLDDGSVAILLAIVLFLVPARREPGGLLEPGAIARVPWEILLLFGGGFALAAGFGTSGLSKALAESFSAFEHLPIVVSLLAACILLTFLTELTSNTATAQMFLPVLAAWAAANGTHPLLLMIPATISASMAFMLPVATPPNAIVFSSRRLRIADMASTGFLLNWIGVFVIVAFAIFILPLVFGFRLDSFPTWAHP